MTKILKYSLLGIYLLCLTMPAQATSRFDSSRPSVKDWVTGGNLSKPSLGLIDPSRLKVQHSVSVGGSFSGGQSLMRSLYATQFTYRLSDPVTLNLVLGVQNLQGQGIPGFNTQNSLLGGFRLDYRPSNKFHFMIQFQQAPQSAFSPYGMNSFYNSSLFGDHFQYLDDVDINHKSRVNR